MRVAREVGRPLVGDRRRPLPAPRGLRPPRGAAVRADQERRSAAPKLTLRHQRVLPALHDEMTEAFAEWPEALATTLEIAERCNVELELGKRLIPSFETPDGERRGRLPARAASRRACACATATRRRPRRVERLEMELGVIDQMGFNAYFLIVWDFVKFAKDNGIAVGPGRGSAAGSIVAYCLADHRRRPAALRPAVRALPQPRARVDARHRHRLLGARAASA